jgi:U3 small nucleolar RNA-associated protein 22
MFFNDPYGGDRIGGIWLPTLKESRQFKVLSGFSSMPLANVSHSMIDLSVVCCAHHRSLKNKEKKDNGLIVLNTAGVLAEIERMGNGMIKKISVQKR